MVTQWAKRAFLSSLGGITGGTLTLTCPDRTYTFGDDQGLAATLTVGDDRFFLRALTGGDIGIGESFMDGDWSTPDLVPLVRLMLRSRGVLEGQSRLAGALHHGLADVLRRVGEGAGGTAQGPVDPLALAHGLVLVRCCW